MEDYTEVQDWRAHDKWLVWAFEANYMKQSAKDSVTLTWK